ncbi:MAG: DUF1365 domain-containing protein [Candidatus Moraniibacteriota bacterium]
MNSCLYILKLFHERLEPRKNSFKYSIYMVYLDLDELDDLQKNNYIFGYNSKNILSFYDEDHFKFLNKTETNAKIIAGENVNYDPQKYVGKNTKERIKILAKELNFDFEIEKVFIFTNLRNFGYIFNPVSFYYCFDKNGKFRVMFSEVNNTFHDQKMYYVLIDDDKKKIFTSRQKKNYYISPFISYDNDLEWRFSIPDESFMMAINSLQGEQIELKTVLTGKRKEITNGGLFWAQLRYPLMTVRVIVLIHYQAAKLYFKKVKFFRKAESDEAIAKIISNKVIK